jgi:hypothetical protein
MQFDLNTDDIYTVRHLFFKLEHANVRVHTWRLQNDAIHTYIKSTAPQSLTVARPCHTSGFVTQLFTYITVNDERHEPATRNVKRDLIIATL